MKTRWMLTLPVLALLAPGLSPRSYAQAATPSSATPASTNPASTAPNQATPSQTAPPAVPGDKSTIVTSVDEVLLDIVVRNKKNKPVLDLKPEDLAITDNGAAVKVSALRLVSEASGDHLVTFLFDRLEPSAQKNARTMAGKILKMVPPGQFSFSVMNVEGRLRLLQDFTSDAAALNRAIDAATEKSEGSKDDAAVTPEKNLVTAAQNGKDPGGNLLNVKQRADARIMLTSLQESQKIVQDQHCRPWLGGLLALARIQRQFPGRKVVIFFQQAPQLDSNAKDMLLTIAGAANRAGVSIYTVDATGVDESAGQGLLATVAMGSQMAAGRMPGPAPAQTGALPVSTPHAPEGSITAGNDSMNRLETEGMTGYKSPLAQLAESTGGAHITATDHLKKPIEQMIEDMTTYYEASYASPIQEYDGSFRPVAIKGVRGELKIRTASGYFAVPPSGGSAMKPFEASLMKVLSDPQLPSDVKFHAGVLRLGDLLEGNENALVVEVPIAGLETLDDPNNNLFSLHVSIVAQIKDKSGVVLEHFSEDVPKHAALDSKGTPGSEFISMQRHFVAAPGQYVMEAVILDRISGKASAQRQEFEIRDTATGPSLSDVAIVKRMDPLAADMETEEPLQYGKSRVVPGISGLVAHGTKEISFFFVIHPDATAKEKPTLEMEIRKSHESIAQVPLQLHNASAAAALPYMASIQSGSLPAGEYEVIEKLTQGEKTVESSMAFRIDGPQLADASTPGADGKADDAGSVTASQLAAAEGTAHEARRLVITALPAGAVPAPSAEQLQTIIAAASKRSLDYSHSLPNFMCVEVTNRSVDQNGNGAWRHRDSIAEMLTYREGRESRSTLEVNGKKSSLKRADMNTSWPMSVGEFGGLLSLVFAPTSKTEFDWKETATLEGNGTVQVFNYRVDRKNATIDLSVGNETVGVGFHGQVYIDAATGGVRRITLQGDDMPRKFSMHGAAMTVDYDYIAIADRDYLLPIRSTVSLQKHRREIELNEIAFRGYRRFASRTKIRMIQ